MFIDWDETSQNSKRWYVGDSNSMGGSRWAFFAIFIVFVIIMILATLRVNRSRSRHGREPIYGTRWMTPPSYFQSQNQYNQPTQRDSEMPNGYVPEYTATANDNDFGYYDQQGNFHHNPNAKEPQVPEQIHHRTTSNTDGVPLADYNHTGDADLHTVHDDADMAFRRPSVPPPATNGEEQTYQRPPGPPPTETINSEEFSPPRGPPPAR